MAETRRFDTWKTVEDPGPNQRENNYGAMLFAAPKPE